MKAISNGTTKCGRFVVVQLGKDESAEMYRKGYRYIITLENLPPLYAKTRRLAEELKNVWYVNEFVSMHRIEQ